VAEEFHRLLPHSELHYIDHCGHAPMMEVPDAFNQILDEFLRKQAS
jgi:pimeloyl-ACP methyl ester carboxylesterase